MTGELKGNKGYILYTCLFLVMCIAAFYPFLTEGKSFIWGAGVEDGLSQHFAALSYYGKWTREVVGNFFNGNFEVPMWNMNLGYGADIIAVLNYYAIGDPLNLLYGFVSEENTELMYHIMILLRLYLAGCAFILYSKKMKKRNFGTVMGALVYVFCGFSFRLGLRHPFFLNSMIYFPLLCYGVEKIYKKEKPYVFILSVCIAAMSNYYFLYMLTIFTVIYAWIRFYAYIKEERVKKFFLTLGKFIGFYILGIGMSAVVLLPSVIGFLGNGRYGAGVDWATLIVYPAKFYILVLSNFIGYGNVGNNTNVGYLPIAGIAVLFVLFSQRMKHRKYRAAFLACIIALAFPIFGFAFNGFSYASNRWSFAFSFIIALLVAETYPRFFLMSKKQKVGIGVGILLYNIMIFAIDWIGKDSLQKNNYGHHAAGLLIAAFFLVFLWFQSKGWDSRKLLGRILISGLMIISAGVHGYYRFDPNQKGYTKEFLDYGTAAETLKAKQVRILNEVDDDSLYRVHAEGFKYKNYGLYNDLNTVSGYYSITPGNVSKAINSYQTLGMQYSDKYHGLDQRSGLLSLAGVKYMTIPEGDDIPDGFHKIDQDGKIGLYENQFALPFAYAYDSYITKNQYDALNGIGREQAMLENVVLEEGNDFSIKNEKVANNLSVTTIPLSSRRISSPKGEKYSQITIPVRKDKEIYLYFKNLEYDDSRSNTENILMSGKKSTDGIRVEQNGTSQKIFIQSTFSPYYFGRKDYMVRLNHDKTIKDEKVKLYFLSPGTYQFDQLYLVEVNKTETQQKLEKLRENALKNITYEGNYFSGEINTDQDKIVCAAIPYSAGWKAAVDGKETKVYQANGMYMGIAVGKGSHKIELRYTTPGLTAGIFISGAAWIVFFGMLIYRKKRRVPQSSIENKE